MAVGARGASIRRTPIAATKRSTPAKTTPATVRYGDTRDIVTSATRAPVGRSHHWPSARHPNPLQPSHRERVGQPRYHQRSSDVNGTKRDIQEIWWERTHEYQASSAS